jgi:hypothetical protein
LVVCDRKASFSAFNTAWAGFFLVQYQILKTSSLYAWVSKVATFLQLVFSVKKLRHAAMAKI